MADQIDHALVSFDIFAFWKALDSRRQRLGMNWWNVAEETGVAPSTLTRIGQGRSPNLDNAVRLASWLDLGLECWTATSGVAAKEAQK